MLKPVFRIHDILVWIQIRIRGSMPLTDGSGFGSGSCYFRHRPSRRQQKINNKKVFLLITFEGTFTSFSKRKSPKKSQKRIKVFLTIFFCLMIEGSGSGSIPMTSGSGRPKTCGSGGSGSGSGTLA